MHSATAGLDCENTRLEIHNPAVPLRVVMLYDDIPAGRRAITVLNRLSEQQGQPVHLFPALWQFDLLGAPVSREKAIVDAVRADLIILSTGKPEAIPAAIEGCVSEVLSRRMGGNTTMIMLFGRDDVWCISLCKVGTAPVNPPSLRARLPSHAELFRRHGAAA